MYSDVQNELARYCQSNYVYAKIYNTENTGVYDLYIIISIKYMFKMCM